MPPKKRRLVFIDDDPAELDDMRCIVEEQYVYEPIRWPTERPLEEVVGDAPSIFVLDLYFPPCGKAPQNQIPDSHLLDQTAHAKRIAEGFAGLYDSHANGKELLRLTFSHIQDAYSLLWEQCRDLEQSPKNGRELLDRLKSIPRYKHVPVVFYSRKVTVPEAVRALQAGAVTVIPKAGSPPSFGEKESILAQLNSAETIYSTWWRVLLARIFGLNVNVTLVSHDMVLQKTEVTMLKTGA